MSSKGGRPTKFKPEFIEQAHKLAVKGWTDAELANFFRVDPRTIYRWKLDNEEFCQALKDGKSAYDDRVERSLSQRAMGYSHPEEKVFVHGGEVIKVEVTKHYPPDTTACIFWLKNRKPDEWSDRKPDRDADDPGDISDTDRWVEQIIKQGPRTH